MRRETEYTYTELIRDTLLRNLYGNQESYWCGQLLPIIEQNARHWNNIGDRYGLHYLGKDWAAIPLTHRTVHELDLPINYLTLHPDYAPKIEQKLLMIVGELAQLEAEEYECSRFLSGLVLFPAPLDVFAKVLGKQLFQECERELADHILNAPNYAWDANAQAALTTYVKHHDYILKAMNQRLLMNMITRDQIRQ